MEAMMKVRRISKKNFDRLTARFKSKERIIVGQVSQWPYETDEEYAVRMKQRDEPPQAFVYHGRYHTIRFVVK